jgi:hypothetical protein
MTGKHYRWHKLWQLDADGAKASHASGLEVHYLPEAAWPVGQAPPQVGGQGVSADGRRWIAFHVGGAAALDAWIKGQAAQGVRGADQLTTRLARLMREAVDLWLHHTNKIDHPHRGISR